MMRAVLTVFLVLFIGISVFPQEVIKEKVEITPTQKNYHKVQGSQSHSLSVNFTWDLPEREANV